MEDNYERIVAEFNLGMNEIKQETMKIGLALPYVIANMAGSFVEDAINDLSVVKNARRSLEENSATDSRNK